MGSYEINTRDESRTFVKSVFNDSVYIAKNEHLLEDVVVYGKYPRGDNNYYEISGAYPYTESDMPSGTFYGEDTNDLSGNYLAMSGLGGGGVVLLVGIKMPPNKISIILHMPIYIVPPASLEQKGHMMFF